MKKIFLLVLCSCFLNSCSKVNEKNGWELIFTNDENGNEVIGSKSALIKSVEAGAEVRIGFGSKERTWHVSDAGFLSIIDGKEVYAQIDRIVGQRPVREEGKSSIEFNVNNRWTRIVGTNGFSTSFMEITTADSTQNNINSKPVSVSWFVHK